MAEFIIHRGSHQIGGMCAEIRTKTSRVIIDMGTNLPGNENNGVISDNELAESLFSQNRQKKHNAIILTHYHGDHIGLFDDIISKTENADYAKFKSTILNKDNDYDIYTGSTAKAVKKNICDFTKNDILKEVYGNSIKTFTDEPIYVGEKDRNGTIKISPILINHSALDSYMFYIEADGKTMLYTGDYRNHGCFLSGNELFQKLAAYSNPDYLVTEGTMISRSDAQKADGKIFSEDDLYIAAKDHFIQSDNNFILVSSTNFDSILSFYKAAVDTQKAFLCDEYQKTQLYTAADFYKKLNADTFDKKKIITIDPKSIDYNDNRLKNGFVMLVRANNNFKTAIHKFEKEFSLIYSMWSGYIAKDPSDEELYKRTDEYSLSISSFLDEFDAEIIKRDGFHTSGHASIECIKKLIKELTPKNVIMLHSEHPERTKEILNDITDIEQPNFIELFDGSVLTLGSNRRSSNLYSHICRFSGNDYNALAKMALEQLDKNKESWTSRFNRYYDEGKFLDKQDFLKEHESSLSVPDTINKYSPISTGKYTVQLRCIGALIAHLVFKSDRWEIRPDAAARFFNVPDGENRTNLDSYLLCHTEWSDEIKTALQEIKLTDKYENNISQEHKLESLIHSEIESGKLSDLEPIQLLKGCRFQMPVPFSANKIAKANYFKYLKKGKGNIDILARNKNGGTLTVIELKDSFESSERPSEAIKQALIYAVFMAKLIQTENAGIWFKTDEKDKNDPLYINKERINAVICMPIKEGEIDRKDISFSSNGNDIKIDSVTIHLDYIYLDADSRKNDKIEIIKKNEIDRFLKKE
ncbi:MAG: MBL fold metallo-hydrolase [Oscillospiraceae bacterium]